MSKTDPKDLHNKKITILVSENELDTINKAKGLWSLSEFIRQCVHDKLISSGYYGNWGDGDYWD